MALPPPGPLHDLLLRVVSADPAQLDKLGAAQLKALLAAYASDAAGAALPTPELQAALRDAITAPGASIVRPDARIMKSGEWPID